MKKHSLLLWLLLCAFTTAVAQRTITGTVTDLDGEALIGASLLVKGTSSGTVTDVDGSFSLNTTVESPVLLVSYTGFETQEVQAGNSTTLTIVMEESVEQLSEVVVTGLGIERDRKALGYGVTTLDSRDIEAKSQSDIAKILSGKATGVDITQTSGLAGTGTNIIIRGYSSITGTNQPMFVIDGVPFNTDTNEDRGFTGGGATASSRFLDLDPNNIAEISILKGLSATVLYGEAGRNGVILVTTKNGNAGANIDKGLEVSLTQSFASSQIANIPDYQNTFGNGFSGDFGWFFSNWGPSFDTRGSNGIAEDGTVEHPYDQSQYNDDFPEYIGARYPYEAFESVENFFESGLTSNTSIAIEKNLGNNSAMSATYSYMNDEGFTPDLDEMRGGGSSNYLQKHNFGLGATTRLGNGLGLKGTFNYVTSNRRVPITGPAFGGDGNGLFAALLFTPRSIDLMNLPYQSPVDGSNVYYRRGSTIQNPRWVLNNSNDGEVIQRFFGTIEADYQFTPWLRGLYRIGIDQYAQNQTRQINKGGAQVPDGYLETSDRLNRITDQVFNLLFDFDLGETFSLDAVLGANLRSETRNYHYTESSQQLIYDLFTHNNFINHTSGSALYRENTIGAYGTATLGFKNFLYLNLQARNDWTSTLEKENRSILYPSVSVSFVPTDAFPGLGGNNILNYMKLRVGYGTSAGYPNPYQTRNVLGTSTRAFVTPGGSVLNTNFVADRLGNRNLAPELHAEWEFGLEANFLYNRLGIDLSLYKKNSSDLIIDLDLDPSTGFTNTTTNAAEIENKGIELGLNITPIRSSNFSWDITLNYTRNISEVLAIADGVDQVVISGYTTLGNFAVVGEQYGIMKGSPFIRDANGELMVNNVGSYSVGSAIDIIGDPNPHFSANWINNLTWKGLSFGFQWQYIEGGDMYSSTVQALLARGNTSDTDVDRYQPIILPGVKADGEPNDIQTYMGDTFFDAYFGADEGGIFDGTVIRLREVSLAYVFPQSLMDKTPFGRLSIALSGQNLWYNAPNFPEGINFDPEVLSLGVGNGRGFDFRTAPTAKRYAVALNVTF